MLKCDLVDQIVFGLEIINYEFVFGFVDVNIEIYNYIKLTVIQLSYASRTTSYSTSFHPFNDLSKII